MRVPLDAGLRLGKAAISSAALAALTIGLPLLLCAGLAHAVRDTEPRQGPVVPQGSHYLWFDESWQLWEALAPSGLPPLSAPDDTCRDLRIGDRYYPKYAFCCDLGAYRSLWALRSGPVSEHHQSCRSWGIR